MKKIYICEYCKDTGYTPPVEIELDGKSEVVFAECDMCDSFLDYEAFVKLLNPSERIMIRFKKIGVKR